MSTHWPNARAHEAQHLLQVYSQLPVEATSGEGVMLNCDDRQIIDFYGGHAVAALGYGHPDMLAALGTQARSLIFQSNAMAMEVRARAADALTAFAPDGLDHAFFVNSGAEANENALRMALRLTGRNKVVAVEHGFHGRTAGAGAVTWGAESWYGFPRTPFDVAFLPRNDVGAIEDIVAHDTAAVILELVQGVAGAFDLDPDFVTAIADTCRRTGALLIVDEVQTGIGRCGAPFASDLYGIKPDLLTVAKSLAGGFPCGALLCTADIAEATRSGSLGTTFGGGPLACALVETVIAVIQRDGLIENVTRVSQQLIDAGPIGPVTAVQGKGFLLGLRCMRPAREISAALLDQGILVGGSADPNVIRLLPPLILQPDHMQKLIDCLREMGTEPRDI